MLKPFVFVYFLAAVVLGEAWTLAKKAFGR